MSTDSADRTPDTGQSSKATLTAVEAARLLGKAERTIRRWIDDGKLPATKISGVYRIDPDDLTGFQPARGLRLLAANESNRSSPSVVAFPSSGPAGLPRPRSSLVGRARELKEICSLLVRDDVTLVTITGPGGVGKTRVALAAAGSVTEDFPGGVWFVPLAPIRAAEHVLPAIGQVVGAREAYGRPLVDAISGAFGDRQTLLVLDNFEQIVEASPHVAELLSRCQRLTILVTSRMRLHLSGEIEVSIPPLPFSKAKSDIPLDQLQDYEALQLFIERGKAVSAGFELSNDNARDISAICERVDGLPLAIELAAARLKVASPGAILDRLEPRLSLLTGGDRDLPERHQTMRGSIASSCDLLSPKHQILFRRLGVFVGGFSLEASESVCETMGESRIETFDGIEALVDLSLLSAVATDHGEQRFIMLETIREYAAELLTASSEESAARDAHAYYYLSVAEQIDPDVFLSMFLSEANWIRRIETDQDNLRAAFDWLCRPETAEACFRLAGALGAFWAARGNVREGEARLARALALPKSTPTAAYAHALHWYGQLGLATGDIERTEAVGREELEIWSELGDNRGIATAYNSLALAYQNMQRWEESGNYFELQLELAREVHTPMTIANILTNFGGVAYGQGDFAQALKLRLEADEIFRRSGKPELVAGNQGHLAMIMAAQGHFATAARLHRDGLVGLASIGWHFDKDLIGLAQVAAEHNLPRVAAELLGAANRTISERGRTLGLFDSRIRAETEQRALATLSPGAFEAGLRRGEALSVDALVPLANRVVEAAEQRAAAPRRRGSAPESGLTPRQLDVLRLIAVEKTDSEIADLLHISLRTVHAHVRAIHEQLDVHSREEAVARARALGYLPTAPSPVTAA